MSEKFGGSPSKTYEKQTAQTMDGLHIGKPYGKMSREEKDYTTEEFRQGRIKVLISAAVIEVGVNAPAATVMVIENAV